MKKLMKDQGFKVEPCLLGASWVWGLDMPGPTGMFLLCRVRVLLGKHESSQDTAGKSTGLLGLCKSTVRTVKSVGLCVSCRWTASMPTIQHQETGSAGHLESKGRPAVPHSDTELTLSLTDRKH